jgi:hypothetical protein
LNKKFAPTQIIKNKLVIIKAKQAEKLSVYVMQTKISSEISKILGLVDGYGGLNLLLSI